MIYGKLNDFEAMGLVALGEATVRSVAWIRSLPTEIREGRYDLDQDGLHAVVMRYNTGGAAESRFETHRRHVDLQYTLAGAEKIDWEPRDDLVDDGSYDPEKDVLFHHPGVVRASVVNAAGLFSIFTPVDAHRPKIRALDFDQVFKLVVKIPISRFSAK